MSLVERTEAAAEAQAIRFVLDGVGVDTLRELEQLVMIGRLRREALVANDPEVAWWRIVAADCEVTIERRPYYCDRGRFIAKMHDRPPLYVDSSDGWPRYYFDIDVAVREIEAWLRCRGQVSGTVELIPGGSA